MNDINETLKNYRQKRSFEKHGPEFVGAGEDELLKRMAQFWMNSPVITKKLADSHGIQYFHFLQPNQYAGKKVLTDEELRMAYTPGAGWGRIAREGYPYLQRAGYELLQGEMRFVDLTDTFDDVEASIYVDACCHVNRLGNVLIARRMVGEILARNPQWKD
jgi:hypothetical protein